MLTLPGPPTPPSTAYASRQSVSPPRATVASPSRPEHAQPLVPSWVLAVLATALVALLATRAHDQPSPIPVAQAPHQALPGPCGPGWQVTQSPQGFTIHTTGVAGPDTSGFCALPIVARSGRLDVHADGGGGAVLRTALTQISATIPASGWYAVAVSPFGDALTVQPAARGADLTFTAVVER